MARKSDVEEVQDLVKDLNDKFAQRLTTRLASANPLLTGLSRSNWVVSQNGVTGGVTVPVRTLFQVQREAHWAVTAHVNTLKSFTVSNNIHYIVPLVKGSSPKAPAGWLDREIDAALSDIYG